MLAISRDHKRIYDLGAETELKSDDILLVISPPEKREELRELFEVRCEKVLFLTNNLPSCIIPYSSIMELKIKYFYKTEGGNPGM